MADSSEDCVFCRIAAGDFPAEIVHTSDRVVAFRDGNPQAPTHVLVIPRDHHRDAVALATADPSAAAELITAAAEVAAVDGLVDGYRIVLNTGPGAGQSVFHVHAHVLGGRDLTWPPG